MVNIEDFLINILAPNLGEPKKRYRQIAFDCSRCDIGNKKNLEICLDENKPNKYLIFHCWSCHFKGHISYLLSLHAANKSWEHIPELKGKETINKNIHIEQELVSEVFLPNNLVPFYTEAKPLKYLTKTRGLSYSLMSQRGVKYNTKDNVVVMPFYDTDNTLKGYCEHNLTTMKYKNIGKLNYVPYVGFINKNYPITLTEGNYDALSGINAIPFLGTNINKEILEFCNGCDIILAVDIMVKKPHREKLINDLVYYGAKNVVEFSLNKRKDLNQLFTQDKQYLVQEYKNIYSVFGYS